MHEAAYDAFVQSKYGRELWTLHYNAGVSLVDDASEMTRCQKIVVQKLDEYWQEKAQENNGSLPSQNVPSNVPTSF